jgi:hypothetical protein
MIWTEQAASDSLMLITHAISLHRSAQSITIDDKTIAADGFDIRLCVVSPFLAMWNQKCGLINVDCESDIRPITIADHTIAADGFDIRL